MKPIILAIFSLSLLSTPVISAETQNVQTPSNKTQATSVSDQNEMNSEAFLNENMKKPGVKMTASGLQYKAITEGTGTRPGPNDVVTVDYVGKLINGTEFDSSYKRGQPATFELSGVIPGWVEGLQLMKKGGTYEFYIPAKLAYGARGVPPVIGPNQALIFEVKLIDVKKE